MDLKTRSEHANNPRIKIIDALVDKCTENNIEVHGMISTPFKHNSRQEQPALTGKKSLLFWITMEYQIGKNHLAAAVFFLIQQAMVLKL